MLPVPPLTGERCHQHMRCTTFRAAEEDLQQELTAAGAAAILRCLASAERLPAMNYGTLCRRLLRAYESGPDGAAAQAGGGAEVAQVQQAVAAFVAAQGSRQQQQYHLADLAGELISQRSLAVAPASSQLQLLQHLPQLLAALPDAQAVSALQEVFDHVSSSQAAVRGGASSQREQQQLLLLQSLEQLLASGSPGTGLHAAAQQAVGQQMLLLMPTPGMYPLSLAAVLPTAAAAAAAEEGVDAEEQPSRALLSPQQRCWAAALRCLRRLPPEQLTAALQHPGLEQQLPAHAAYATAALVAAGALDSRALQHPRNLLLLAGTSPSRQVSWEQQQGMIALCTGRAVATLPASLQKQWLLDTLEACKVRRPGMQALSVGTQLPCMLSAAPMPLPCRSACPIMLPRPPGACPHAACRRVPTRPELSCWQLASPPALQLHPWTPPS